MVDNAAFKKVLSISDGNFHSCYASNKAEKFKFRRLSLGLESCAQAQFLKFRKEEKHLHEQLQQLKLEKAKNDIVKKGSIFGDQYLNQSVSSSSSGFRRQLSSNFDNHVSLYSRDSLNRLSRTVSTPNKLRKKNTGEIGDSIHDVVPFYMQHSYSPYHHEPHYENFPDLSDELTSRKNTVNSDEPCWKNTTSLSHLKEGHVDVHNPKFVQTIKVKENSFTQNHLKDDRIFLSTKIAGVNNRSLSVLKSVGSSIQTLSNTDNKQSSVLTQQERQELLARHISHCANSFTNVHHKANNNMAESQRARKHTAYTMSRMNLLEKTVLGRLKRGDRIEELLNEESVKAALDNYDEGRLCPAYNPNSKMPFEDFRALRKCKYLRVSDLNRESLRQATLETMINA